MDLSIFATPEAWISLVTLMFLEIVLGVDNLVFIVLTSDRLPPEKQHIGRKLGLLGALVSRCIFLCFASFLVHMTDKLFTIPGLYINGAEFGLSVRDLVLFLGGLFYSEAVAQMVRENEAAYCRKTGMRTAVCANDKPYYDSLPLSSVVRPAWDADALAQVGFDGITVIEDAGKEVYLDWEYELYGASPLFAVVAEKPVAAPEGTETFNVLKATRDYWNERSSTFGLDGSIDKWGDLIQQKLLQRGVTSPWILDAGCGTGAMALTLASRGYRVCGVDFSQGMLLHARMNAKHQGLEIPLVLGCVDQLPFVSETFDVVVSRNVLSNLAVAKEALESWRDALRPGGYLVYFDSSWWHYLHEESLDAKRALAYGTGSSPIFNVLEELAKDMPIAAADRPAWDVMALRSLGFEVEAVEDVSSRVWTAEEQQRYEFAPQFMVVARKPVR